MRIEPAGIPFWSREEVEAALAPTIAYLQTGGVLAYPTETHYRNRLIDEDENVKRKGRHSLIHTEKPV